MRERRVGAEDPEGLGQMRRRKSVFTGDVLLAIPRWVAMGADRRLIADVLGTTVPSLQVTCNRHGISLKTPEDSTPTLRRVLGVQSYSALDAEAERRGVSAARLLSVIVSVIVQDNLFDAVLDDSTIFDSTDQLYEDDSGEGEQ